MEPDEIGVVLARASDLHGKISEAIERSSNAEGNGAAGRGPVARDSENSGVSSSSGAEDSGLADGDRGDKKVEAEGIQRSAVGVDSSAEVRSLAGIRDALETLEEQLESLQAIQQQQRAEKDKALAELEESRRLLLRRLKEHRGQEWEVVHEALAFAGEPVEDRDDLPLPPYPMPLTDSAFQLPMEDQFRSYPTHSRASGQMRRLSMAGGPGFRESMDDLNFRVLADDSEEDLLEEDEEEEGESPRVEHGRKPGRGFFASVLGLTTKAALVVVSVLAALAVSEMSHRLEKKRYGGSISQNQIQSPARQSAPAVEQECPPGKKLIIEEGNPKCVVKERVELPFPRGIRNPDVLYGRG